jgi:Mn2+/Fe2+ NRAMP family transporter
VGLALAAGAIIVTLLPIPRLIPITILSQVINGAVLPLVLIFMLLLINKRDLMGKYVNTRTFNIIAWVTTVVVIVMTAGYVWTLRK